MFPTPDTGHVDVERVYEPAEDSFLLLDLLESESEFLKSRFSSNGPSPLVLELGIGSGIVSAFVQQNILRDALYIGTDINPYACIASLETSKQNGGTSYFDVIRTDLTGGLRIAVDILIFNPPYVPDESVPSIQDSLAKDDWIDFALLGGKDGMQITYHVLNNLETTIDLTRGVAYILFCRRNRPNEVAEYMRTKGWIVTLIGERRAGWEILSVWKFTKDSNCHVKHCNT
ncbi:hypothetical protein V1511DRAFT_505452 [Dipodascopsis uninucleata]